MSRIILLLGLLIVVTASHAALRDPTSPPGMHSGQHMFTNGDIKLKSIVVEPNRKTVLIGNQYYTVGDKVMGAKIVAITHDAVKLKSSSGAFTVSMFQPVVKKGADK